MGGRADGKVMVRLTQVGRKGRWEGHGEVDTGWEGGQMGRSW